jgi:hypothetical protein
VRNRRLTDIPEVSLGSDAHVLQHKPDANLVVRVRELGSTGREAAN